MRIQIKSLRAMRRRVICPRSLKVVGAAALTCMLSASQASAADTFRFALARYTAAGLLDAPAFDLDGRVVTDFPNGTTEEGQDVKIDAAGRIVVAGHALVNGSYQFALARYWANGTPDAGFVGGRVLTSFPGALGARAYSLAIDAAGRIVVAGYAHTPGGSRFALARYLANGVLDNTFDGDGRLLTDFPESAGEGIDAVAIDPVGRIVAAGTGIVGGRTRFLLARYTPAVGALDPAFDFDGRVLTDMGVAGVGGGWAEDLAIEPISGKIVVAGYSGVAGDYRIALSRYHANGALDATFDGDGRVRTDVAGSPVDTAKGVAITAGNKIVVAGWANLIVGGTRVALARYAWNGGLDPTFGVGGITLTNVAGATGEAAYDVAVDAAGRAVVAGGASAGAGGDRLLSARYTLNGTLDPAFGIGGVAMTDFPAGLRERGHALAIDAAGRIVVVGRL